MNNRRKTYYPWLLLILIGLALCWLLLPEFEGNNHELKVAETELSITDTSENTSSSMGEVITAVEDDQQTSSSQLTWLVRPDHRLSGRLVDHLAQLKARYAQGELEAGFILAVNLSTCDRAPHSKQALDSRVDLWIEEGRGQNFIDNLISRYDFCEGVGPEERAQHLAYFTDLADSTYIPAMEVLGSIFDKAYMQISKQADLPRDEYVKQKRLFQHKKYDYLKQAASQGSMYALQMLAGMNAHKPDWTQTELQQGYSSVSLALAHSMALLHFSEDNLTYSRASFRQDKLLKLATAQEVTLAEQLAAKLIQAIQSAGQAYTAIKENYR